MRLLKFFKTLIVFLLVCFLTTKNLMAENIMADTHKSKVTYQKAVLSGGCFWGVEKLFSERDGIIDVVNGYTGGSFANPTYQDITTGSTGHAEAVEVTFNPEKISYEAVLKFFFKIHNPTTLNRQKNDIGSQYRSAIFYADAEQKNIALNVILEGNRSGVFDNPIVTTIEKLDTFYPAEEYHQNYLTKNPNGYTCHAIHDDWTF
jgi:methionine-S-sulfoxide reductase